MYVERNTEKRIKKSGTSYEISPYFPDIRIKFFQQNEWQDLIGYIRKTDTYIVFFSFLVERINKALIPSGFTEELLASSEKRVLIFAKDSANYIIFILLVLS